MCKEVSAIITRRLAIGAASGLLLGAISPPAMAQPRAKAPKGTMRVYQVGAQKSVETLALVRRPIPEPGPGQGLIKVHYAGIAARDLGIAAGRFPVPPGPRPASLIPLSEGAGDVVALGPGENRIKIGDRVTSPHWARWVSGPWSPNNYEADVGNTIEIGRAHV